MAKINEKHLVTKRNLLNQMRANSMTLQELRFFTIYLSKINPKDTNTRIVRFPLHDFQAIMELGRVNINYLKTVSNSLLSKIVNVPNERGGYEAFQLFKKCRVDIDETGEWYFEINAHDDALPLMFDFKNRYFSYELWNALRLKSSNQIRMYEILKQYEKIGFKVMTVEALKEDLGIGKNEYPRFGDFKHRVLDSCQEALSENTDISFTYEPYGKKGKGGKVLALKFTIEKNKNHVDQLTLSEFIDQQPELDLEHESNLYDERMSFISEACNNEFKTSEMQVLYNLANQILSYDDFRNDTTIYDFFKSKYDVMLMNDERSKIHKRFSYIKALFEAELRS